MNTCPTGCVSYPSPQAAYRAAHAMCSRKSKTDRKRVTPGQISHVPCPCCHQWHVGRKHG